MGWRTPQLAWPAVSCVGQASLLAVGTCVVTIGLMVMASGCSQGPAPAQAQEAPHDPAAVAPGGQFTFFVNTQVDNFTFDLDSLLPIATKRKGRVLSFSGTLQSADEAWVVARIGHQDYWIPSRLVLLIKSES